MNPLVLIIILLRTRGVFSCSFWLLGEQLIVGPPSLFLYLRSDQTSCSLADWRTADVAAILASILA